MLISEYYLLILSCLIVVKASYANQNSSCNPSSCGDVRNISYPFRLKDDPQHCGDSIYEISCENNTEASIYVHSHKYHVRAINYQNYTIRLADPTIKNNETCSFPFYFPNWEYISSFDSFPYSIFSYNFREEKRPTRIARPITFFSCPFPLNYSPIIPTDRCVSSSSNTSILRHTYIKVGDLYAKDVRDLCTIDLVVMTSSALIHDDRENSLSFSEIHDSLLYGFELSWSNVYCSQMCNVHEVCGFDANGVVCVTKHCYQRFTYKKVLRNISRRIFDEGSLDGKVTVVSCPDRWYYFALASKKFLTLLYFTV
ncbi:uncharacterized protein [Primulina huaijiensis]|uniref:uncharacterized protein n=1 Tax=Primulina huaijiensis TaxID=1492673 RepID=UPI003CC77A8E